MKITDLEDAMGGRSRQLEDRIHRYLALGLLQTEGSPNPGTGHSRQYADGSIERLRVLEDLNKLRVDLAGRERFVAKVVSDKKLCAAVHLLKEAMMVSA